MRFALLFLLAACEVKVTTPTKVDVSCETTKEGVTCDAKQSVGTSEAEACWDFIVSCANGATVKAPHMCAKVKDGGTTKVTMGNDKLVDRDKCGGDKPPTGKVENFTIDGKTPDSVTPTTK